jgi:hypothetical protein
MAVAEEPAADPASDPPAIALNAPQRELQNALSAGLRSGVTCSEQPNLGCSPPGSGDVLAS